MIKGWRNNPNWVHLHEARIANRDHSRYLANITKIQEQARDLQAEFNDRQKVELIRQAEHRAECHAMNEAAGTLTSQLRGKPN